MTFGGTREVELGWRALVSPRPDRERGGGDNGSSAREEGRLAETTEIQWADSTTNPVMGCEGCELAVPGVGGPCYAYVLHDVIGRAQNSSGYAPSFFLPTLFRDAANPGRRTPWRFARDRRATADLRGRPRPDKPWLDGLPRLIFLSDMGDAFSRGDFVDSADVAFVPGPGRRARAPRAGSVRQGGVPFEFLEEEVVKAVLSPGGRRHHWQWLTKQPGRMADFSRWLAERGTPWPENLWAGTSVTGKGVLERLDHLARVGDERTIRFVSVEPLFHELGLRDTPIGRGGRWWVIVGGESRQPRAETRRTDLAWLRRVRDECAALGVPLFVKQLGGNLVERGEARCFSDGKEKGHHGDWSVWPEDLRVRQLPAL